MYAPGGDQIKDSWVYIRILCIWNGNYEYEKFVDHS